MKELIHYIRSSFKKCIDFKSRINRFEFFVGLAASGLFFALNALIFIKFNSYANYLRDMDLSLISYLYILIVMLFSFIQCHSLVARRLNDVSVNPYFAFIPFLLAYSYLLIKSFYDTYEYGQLIFIVILLVIVITITLLVSETD
jgi:uncharacterized membrane protein YhaH (DUF805 family)